jgi:hypothetical protein
MRPEDQLYEQHTHHVVNRHSFHEEINCRSHGVYQHSSVFNVSSRNKQDRTHQLDEYYIAHRGGRPDAVRGFNNLPEFMREQWGSSHFACSHRNGPSEKPDNQHTKSCSKKFVTFVAEPPRASTPISGYWATEQMTDFVTEKPW